MTARRWCEHAAAAAGSRCECWTRGVEGSHRLPEGLAILHINGVGQFTGRGSGYTEAEAEEYAYVALRGEMRSLAAGVTAADDAAAGE